MAHHLSSDVATVERKTIEPPLPIAPIQPDLWIRPLNDPVSRVATVGPPSPVCTGVSNPTAGHILVNITSNDHHGWYQLWQTDVSTCRPAHPSPSGSNCHTRMMMKIQVTIWWVLVGSASNRVPPSPNEGPNRKDQIELDLSCFV